MRNGLSNGPAHAGAGNPAPEPAEAADASPEDAAALRQRPIRSFVLRQGRITQAQQRAYDALLPAFGIPYSPTLLDPVAALGRPPPLLL